MKERPAGLFGGMSIELGKVGIWRHPSGLTPEVVAEVEALGYGTIWVGGSPPGDLAVVEQLLDTTGHIAVATGIVNVWKDDAATVGGSYHRITARHPGRFLLGLGIGNRLDAVGVLALLSLGLLELAFGSQRIVPDHRADEFLRLALDRIHQTLARLVCLIVFCHRLSSCPGTTRDEFVPVLSCNRSEDSEAAEICVKSKGRTT